MARKTVPPPVQVREFNSVQEIDAFTKLNRRIEDIEKLDVQEAVLAQNGAEEVVQSSITATIRDVFGADSPEFNEHS